LAPESMLSSKLRARSSFRGTCNVLPKRQTDPQSQAGRLSLQGLRVRYVQKEEDLQAEKSEIASV
jgi:hypothetical protein